ncbi:class I SAM-dependent methyltransferase [Nocardia sp. NPDC088792]|uniref:class I SAM-dependent methyltransferase n=1 Tax=Nocardia sp. NPDC088792 TaxID=3364332 RepID=UPI0038018E87
MGRDRDVGAFDRRAPTYDEGYLGQMHRDIAARTIVLALAARPEPGRVLDVGCGTGVALRELAERLPRARRLIGVDAAAGMVEVARERLGDNRIEVVQGKAEALPVESGAFDLVISITSFDHWGDQGAGLRECARALTPSGVFVLTDLFSPLLAPTMVIGRRGRARTRRAGAELLRRAGLVEQQWHGGFLIRTVVASARPPEAETSL